MNKEEPENIGTVADATTGNWVDIFPVSWAKPYLRLSRMDRPIGTWLLFIPCLWGAILAFAAGHGDVYLVFWVITICFFGSFLMRGAGCTWNDFTDRKIDAQVARTKSRPLPSGAVSPKQALTWMCIQSIISFGLLINLNINAILLGVAALVPVCLYPFAKRFTWWPQFFLGITFNWGVLLAWVAVAGSLDWPAIYLYLAGITWTLFYDTIYAHQDKEDDALIGVKSTALLFAGRTQRALFIFLLLTVILATIAVIYAFPDDQQIFLLTAALFGVWGFGYQMHWTLTRLNQDDPENCLFLFRKTNIGGFILTFGLIFAALLGQLALLD